MSFWDTVAGYRLAEVLSHCLPKIAEAMNDTHYKPEQNMSQIPAAEVHNYLQEELISGRRLVQAISVPTENGMEYVVVTE